MCPDIFEFCKGKEIVVGTHIAGMRLDLSGSSGTLLDLHFGLEFDNSGPENVVKDIPLDGLDILSVYKELSLGQQLFLNGTIMKMTEGWTLVKLHRGEPVWLPTLLLYDYAEKVDGSDHVDLLVREIFAGMIARIRGEGARSLTVKRLSFGCGHHIFWTDRKRLSRKSDYEIPDKFVDKIPYLFSEGINGRGLLASVFHKGDKLVGEMSLSFDQNDNEPLPWHWHILEKNGKKAAVIPADVVPMNFIHDSKGTFIRIINAFPQNNEDVSYVIGPDEWRIVERLAPEEGWEKYKFLPPVQNGEKAGISLDIIHEKFTEIIKRAFREREKELFDSDILVNQFESFPEFSVININEAKEIPSKIIHGQDLLNLKI